MTTLAVSSTIAVSAHQQAASVLCEFGVTDSEDINRFGRYLSGENKSLTANLLDDEALCAHIARERAYWTEVEISDRIRDLTAGEHLRAHGRVSRPIAVPPFR